MEVNPRRIARRGFINRSKTWCGQKRNLGRAKGPVVPHAVRDRVVDFLKHYHQLTGLAWCCSLPGWGSPPVNSIAGKIATVKPMNITPSFPAIIGLNQRSERLVIQFALQYLLEGYRRLTFMRLDRDVAAVSPATLPGCSRELA
jgi:putative transposase